MDSGAERIEDRGTLEGSVCIVGAGPAGLVLAAELARRQDDVILLESGAPRPGPGAHPLDDGDVTGDPYAALGTARPRQAGGRSRLWNTPVGDSVGAKYVPLDAVDLEPRHAAASRGWPLAWEELRSWYERAQTLCGLGPFAYDAAAWTTPGCAPLADAGPDLVSRVYQLGRRDALVDALLAVVRRADSARLVEGATVVRLETDGTGRRVVRALVARPGGARLTVRARHFVLAAGAVENARLLLLSGERPEGLGNDSGWVGRGFMEHPRDTALTLVPRSTDAYHALAFYDAHRHADGTLVAGRLAVREEAIRAGQLPNASVTLLPRLAPRVRRARDLLGRVGLVAVARRALPRGGHGWSRTWAPGAAFDGLTILLNLEQSPDPANRVGLSTRRDQLGVPLPVLEWRWRADDQLRLQRLRAVVRQAFEDAGMGRVEGRADAHPDPNAHHHAGTTRMSAEARDGVVDATGRVHALDNLHIAGASVFPTCGYANPVLTIVALAARLADELHGRL